MQAEEPSAFGTVVITLRQVSESPGGLFQQALPAGPEFLIQRVWVWPQCLHV